MRSKSIAIRTLGPLDEILNTPVEDLKIGDQLDAWCLMDYMGKLIEKRKKALRIGLLAHAKEYGKLDPESSCITKVVEMNGGSAAHQEQERSVLQKRDVEALLKDKKIALKSGGAMSFAPNMKKLEALVAAKKLTGDELNGCFKISEINKLLIKRPPHVVEAIAKFESRQLKAPVDSKVF